ncbi:MAG: hypothetical protein EKK55_23090 [Rhodocyclaceae bacterium]|nr:MAG: hypothetical protein EKK55_23090 [Rhodocyclaceae bacterium]
MNVREVSESAGLTVEELDAALDVVGWMLEHPSYRYDEDTAALRHTRTLLQVEMQSRSQARSSADAYRRLAHDLLSLRDADPAAYRALMARLAFAEGRPRPRPDAIDVRELVGNVLAPTDDADIESEDEV